MRTLGPGDDLTAVRWCPTQLQRFVPGAEYRVHAVGERLFANRIRTEAVDYRYGGFSLEPADLPDVVAERCRALTAALGLELRFADVPSSLPHALGCFARLDAGYAWTPGAKLSLEAEGSGAPVRTQPLELGELALGGPFFRASIGVGY